jgi:GNAT superfamily N-acetyltransferase
MAAPADDLVIRSDLRPGDIGAVVSRHGILYAREQGFDPTFEAYVAGPLSDFVRNRAEGDRIWLAEREGRLVGCIAIVAAGKGEAQLRWYLVDPAERGRGLGRRLLEDALRFCRERGYRTVVLWTVRALTRAASLYRKAGFELVEERPAHRWGTEVVEEKYRLTL